MSPAWPDKVYDDWGRGYTFAGVDPRDGRGMYGGMSGLSMSAREAQKYAERKRVLCEARCELGTGPGTCPTCGAVYKR